MMIKNYCELTYITAGIWQKVETEIKAETLTKRLLFSLIF